MRLNTLIFTTFIFLATLNNASFASSISTAKNQSGVMVNCCQRPDDKSPIPVKVIQTQADGAHITERENKTDKFNDNYLETQISSALSAKVLKWTAVVQTIFGVIVAILIIFTYRETRKTAQSSILAAKAAQKSAEIAETSLINSERAWVGVDGVDVRDALSVGNVPDVTLIVRNSGRTPALKLRAVFKWEIGQLSNITELEPPNIPDESPVTVLFPNGTSNFHPLVNMRPISQEQIDTIRNGDITIVIVGRFEYLDTFNNAHTTKIRIYYKSNRNSFGPTIDGNYAD